MKLRWIKTHKFIKLLFPTYVWDIPNKKNTVFLTFDDGPTPEITEWTLSLLKKYNAKATFFCIGDNIKKFPQVFEKIYLDNHAIGNHTFNHLKGWKTNSSQYVENTKKCEDEIIKYTPEIYTQQSMLFRPPYGKISIHQSWKLKKLGFKIIMWDIISYDFDSNISGEQCLEHVLKNVKSGSIIVFHDSVKAFKNLKIALPETLRVLSEKGFVFDKIK